MFDKLPVPGRNDPCWCGSGRKYKKCHGPADERMERLYLDGEEVLPRSLLKTAADIEGIKASAAVNMGVLDYVGEHIAAGVSTMDINRWVEEYLSAHDAVSADLNFEGYPYSVCTSINDVICHGFPNERTSFRMATSSTSICPPSRRVLLGFQPHVLHWRGL